MKKLLALSLVLVMLVSVFGCQPAATNDDPTPPAQTPGGQTKDEDITTAEPVQSAAPEAQIADTIYLACNEENPVLNPLLSNSTTANQIYHNVYAKLWKFNEKGEVVNDLLEDWSVTEDGLTYTLKLKQGCKFSDGSEITMNDVAATINTAKNHDASPMGEELWFISSVEVVDDYNAIFHLDNPYPALRNVMSCNVGVVCSAKVFEMDEEQVNIDPSTFIFSGAYKITEWKQNEQLVLEVNEHYYGEKPPTQKLVIVPISEPGSRLVALETGEVDVAYQMQAEQNEILRTMPDKFRVELWGTAGGRVFRFGCNDPIIGDVRVRQAIQKTVDAGAICEALFPGMYKRYTSGLLAGTLGYKDLGTHEPDLEEAKRLLAEAGYPDGFDTQIYATPRYAKGVELAEAISDQLKQVGINAEVIVQEYAVIREQWTGQTAETFHQPIFIMGVGCDTLDADTALNRLYTTSKDGTNTGTNYGFYSNAEVDELVAAAAISTDQEFRRQCYERVSEIVYNEDPSQLYLFETVFAYGIANEVQGFWFDPSGAMHLEDIYKTVG